jgi:hypothetical protein
LLLRVDWSQNPKHMVKNEFLQVDLLFET